MIKVIRDLVKPQFLVVCDASCLTNITVFFEPGSAEYEERQQAAFAGALIAGGWKVTLARQLCPAHYKREDAAALLSLDCGALKN